MVSFYYLLGAQPQNHDFCFAVMYLTFLALTLVLYLEMDILVFGAFSELMHNTFRYAVGVIYTDHCIIYVCINF